MKEKLASIICQLNLFSPEHSDNYATGKFTQLISVNFYHDTYRKKLNISIGASRATGLFYSDWADLDSAPYDIKVSPDRTAESIAIDVRRRLLKPEVITAFEADLVKAINRTNNTKEVKKKSEVDLEYVKQKIGELWVSNRRVEICEYGRVKIKADHLSKELIVKIVKMIDDYMGAV
ncbi:MAG: hypothetical protein RIQ94_164 [Pseudomonadota bacterium]|jgi:hypothetical protein